MSSLDTAKESVFTRSLHKLIKKVNDEITCSFILVFSESKTNVVI